MSGPAAAGTPLRVCQVIGALSPGGAEMAVAGIMRELARRGCQVEAVCLREIGALGEELAAEGFAVELIRFRSRFHPLDLVRLARHFRRRRFDVVHTHMRRAGTSGRLAALLARVPAVFAHYHNYGLDDRPIHHRIDRFLLARSAGALAVEEGVRRHRLQATGAAAGKIVLIENAVPLADYVPDHDPIGLRRRLGLPLSGSLIGIVARLHPVKRHDLFLQAARRLLDERLEATFLVIGDGRERPALEALAAELGLGERVRFLGLRRDVPRILAVLAVLVLCSDSEGRPLAALEAVAAGLPLVATPVGGCPELLGPELAELIVPPGDPVALAAAIRRALDPEVALAVHRRFAELRPSISLEAYGARLEAVYRAALAGPGGPESGR